jgi:hypothetical protein
MRAIIVAITLDSTIATTTTVAIATTTTKHSPLLVAIRIVARVERRDVLAITSNQLAAVTK